jgi:ADP-ribose pyrophosphatase YjhB (NUDIX family)
MNIIEQLSQLHLYERKIELNTSVDCVIFCIKDSELKVLLTSFSNEIGWMLPGGFIGTLENADSAAERILQERTGAKNVYLQQFKVFSNPNRFSFETLISKMKLNETEKENIDKLPKRVFSVGYFALVNAESLLLTGGKMEENTFWAAMHQLPELIYDHKEIILEALKALQKELYFSPIAYNLLPEKFTMPELQKLYETILNKKIERSSFQRKMLNWGIYERLEERREGVAHKRPFLYRFDMQKYKQAKKQGNNFAV